MQVIVIIYLVVMIRGAIGKTFFNKTSRTNQNVELEGKQVPHEIQCSLYYRYVYGVKVLKECYEGKLFNTEISNCDYSYNVDCGNRSYPEERESSSEYYYIENDNWNIIENSIPSECPIKEDPYELDVLMAHEQSCSHYYRCINGKKYLMKCPGILQFNRRVLVCDWPSKARCYSKWYTSSSSTTTETPSSTNTSIVIVS
ncbi:protein obstructor-E-like [Diorhabda carinulata]|uniref:protein obstructor-E-like n=1 Tax=Diorhabda carinulata TaxID=1163345 RepID=UPI0025A2DBD9|nr:protein obstructor-E-like [Diorhabda carinulata]